MRDQLLSVVSPIVRTAIKLRDEWATGTGPPFDAGRELLINIGVIEEHINKLKELGFNLDGTSVSLDAMSAAARRNAEALAQAEAQVRDLQVTAGPCHQWVVAVKLAP